MDYIQYSSTNLILCFTDIHFVYMLFYLLQNVCAVPKVNSSTSSVPGSEMKGTKILSFDGKIQGKRIMPLQSCRIGKHSSTPFVISSDSPTDSDFEECGCYASDIPSTSSSLSGSESKIEEAEVANADDGSNNDSNGNDYQDLPTEPVGHLYQPPVRRRVSAPFTSADDTNMDPCLRQYFRDFLPQYYYKWS